MKLIKMISLVFLLLQTQISQKLYAQCNTNTSICTPGTAGPFTFINPGPVVSDCLNFFGPSYGYIILHITSSGPLDLLINGNSTTGFLDVAVFDIPNGSDPCSAIQSLNNEIGCNYASSASGCNQFGTSFPCSASVPAPNVVAGQTLMIVVENWSGASSGSSTNFTLDLGPTPGAQTGPPDPTINPAGPFCTSSPSTQLTAVNSGGTWSGTGVSATGMFNPATAGVGTHTINYSVGVTPCDAQSSTTIVVNSPGSLVVSPPISICQGSSTTLTASGAGTYTWSPSTGLNTTSGGTVTANPSVTTTYTVTGNTAGCTSSVTTTVTVNTCGCTTTASNSGPVCSGASFSLNSTTVTGSTYSWTGTGATSYTTPDIASITAPSTPGSYPYTVTATDGVSTCTSTTNLIVNPLPTINAGLDQSVCSGTSVTLSGSGGTSYTWNNGVTNGISFSQAVGTTTYTVIGTDANGCTNTDQVSVVVNPNPSPVITGPTEYCTGFPATLDAGSGYSSYLWSNGTTTETGSFTAADNPITVAVTNSSDCSVTSAPFNLTAVPAVTTNSSFQLCQGQSMVIHGITETTTGVYSQTFPTASGCDSTSNVTLTVNPLPTINAGLDQSVCSGTSVTLSGSGGTSYTWNNGVTNGISFSQAVGTTTYTVTGTDVNGCTNTDQVSVVVNPNPSPVITGPTDYCTGFPATLDAGSGYSSYLWSNGTTTETGSFTAADNPITVTVTNPSGCSVTSAPFNLTAVSAVTTNSSFQLCQGQSMVIHGITETTTGVYSQTFPTASGCDSTSNVTLTVNPLPTVNAGLDQTVCQGTSVTLTGSGATTYTWDNGVPNGIAFTQSLGTTVYTLTGTDVNGCTNTDQVSITVNAIPIVNAGLDQSVCIGTQVTLTATGATTYTWDNGVTNGTAFTPSVGSITYTVSGTTSGCVSGDQVVVTVNPLPIVSAGNDLTECSGTVVVLTGSGANTYSWDNGITNGAGFAALATTTYTVTGTDANGCVNTDQVTVNVSSGPIVSFTGNNLIGCSPLTVDLTNTTVGNNFSDCKWTFSDGTMATGCGGITETFSSVGCYDVKLTVTTTDGCVSTLTMPDYVCVEPEPVASFHASPDKLSTIAWTADMINTSTGGDTYDWTFGDGSGSSSDFEPTHAFPNDKPGTYLITLKVTNTGGCEDDTSLIIVVTEDLIFYVPNTFTPDNDSYNQVFKPIFTSGFDPYNYTLYIFDRWGEILFESHNTNVGWDGTYGGKLVQDGTYVWKIIFKRNGIDKHEEHTGSVNLLK